MQAFGKLGVTVVILLLVASCAPGAPTAAPTKPAPPAAPTQPAAPPAATAPAATAPTAAPTAKPTAPPAAKVKRGGTLIRADFRDATTFDPIFALNSGEVAESSALEALLSWNLVDEKTGKHEPGSWLAESWQVVDPKTITLKLQKGVKFHDGSEFNAEVVKWNLDRAKNHPKTVAKAYVGAINSVDAVDPSTVKLNLTGPSATIFVNLTNAAGGTGSTFSLITSKAAYDKQGEEAMQRTAVGTGPFTLVDWKRDDRATYKKFDGYWKNGEDGQKLPYLDAIEVRVLRDRSVAALEARAGTVHIFKQLEPKDVASVTSNPELVFFNTPWAAAPHSIAINPAREPFGNNLKLRQAAQYSIDREAIAKTLGFGHMVPAYYHFWHAAMPGYDEKNPKYTLDVDKAKALVKEAGFPDGANIEINFTSNAVGRNFTELAQAMMAKAGIQVKANGMDATTQKQTAISANFEANTWEGFPSPDPDHYTRFFTCDGAMNWGNYCNPEIDKCFAEGVQVYDFNQRAEVYKKCQRILYEGAYNMGLVRLEWNIVARKEVKNFKANNHLVNLREIWLDK